MSASRTRYVVNNMSIQGSINKFISGFAEGKQSWKGIWNVLEKTQAKYFYIRNGHGSAYIDIDAFGQFVLYIDKNTPFQYKLSLSDVDPVDEYDPDNPQTTVQRVFNYGDYDGYDGLYIYPQATIHFAYTSPQMAINNADNYIRGQYKQYLLCIKMLKCDIPGVRELILSFISYDVKTVCAEPLIIDYKGAICQYDNDRKRFIIKNKSNIKTANAVKFIESDCSEIKPSNIKSRAKTFIQYCLNYVALHDLFSPGYENLIYIYIGMVMILLLGIIQMIFEFA